MRPEGGIASDALRVPAPAEAAGERLDRFLASLPEVGSRAAAERLLEAGAAGVGGTPRPESHPPEGGGQGGGAGAGNVARGGEQEGGPRAVGAAGEHLPGGAKPPGGGV